MRPSVAIWSLRLRPARSLPPSSGPSVVDEPALEGAVHVLVGLVRRQRAVGGAASRRSSAGEHGLELVGRQVARAVCRARACARDPAMSYGASCQSKCVDFG